MINRSYFFNFLLCIFLLNSNVVTAQIKILFDDTHAETSGNTADWTIDCPLANQDLCWTSTNNAYTGGNCYHSGPLQIPTPAQSGITSSTPETYWTGSLSNWAVDLVKLDYGYVIETLPYNGALTYGDNSNPQDLTHYKVFIIDEPNNPFNTSEKSALVNFVKNGGGLYLISDHNGSDRDGNGWDSPHIWQDFATTTGNVFGITPDLVDISPTISALPNLPNDSCLHGPMGTVTGIKYHQGTTFTIDPTINPSVVGIAYNSGTSGNLGVLAGHSRYGKGKIAFLGDSSPTDDGTGNTANPNINLNNSYTADVNGSHQKLLVNSTVWLAEEDSTGTLTVTANGGNTICKGQTITLNASGGSSYSWSPGGDTTASITVSPSTTTTYSVSSVVNGSNMNQSITITVNDKPTTGFSASIAGKTVNFINSSQSAITYSWNFGDGSALNTSADPVHIYANNGTYLVMLICINGCGADTITKQVAINVSEIDDQNSNNGMVVSCLGQDEFLISNLNANEIDGYLFLYSMTGQEVMRIYLNANEKSKIINVHSLSSGVYFLRAGNLIEKIISK